VSDISTKARWHPSPVAFDRFLAALDTDRTRAGERYEQIRSRLLRFFEWRGTRFPDEHADDTLNRVMRKLEEGEDLRDAGTYCYGVARLVLLEALKEQERRDEALDRFQVVAAQRPIEADEANVDEERLGCLETCMNGLPAAQRSLIVEYYGNSEGERIRARRSLAQRLGIGMNALRIRAHRLSDTLQRCVGACVGRSATVK
jgi:DNA-directed RNA polymerase specialized sigma24 family protein